LADFYEFQFIQHCFGFDIALARIGLAGAMDDGLQFEPALAVGARREVGGRLREVAMAFAGADYVKPRL